MPRFFIEVPHAPGTRDCNMAIAAFLRTGSHFLTHADWGCKDGEHKAWLVVDVGNKEEARSIVPADFRSKAKITRLTTFKLEEIEAALRAHQA